jgi:NADPH-dependent ferric siderophore reductase
VQGVIDEVELVTDRMRRIRITGERLRTLTWLPGQQVRVHVSPPRQWLRRPWDALRTYSIWRHDPARGSLELCVLDHGHGPGAEWSRRARPGQEVGLSKPEGKLTLRDSPRHLFIGEETAAVPFSAMLAALPPEARVDGVLETDGPDGEVPLPDGRALPWVHRGAASGAGSATLLDAARALDVGAESCTAYIAGEARTCQAVRQHLLRDRAWPRDRIVVKPFWTPGRRGME